LAVQEAERRWQLTAQKFCKPELFPAFCGRQEFWSWYDVLMAPENVQHGLSELTEGGLQFLGIGSESDRENESGAIQFGRTRLLREFAAQAARDGHLPCLIPFSADKRPKGDLSVLLQALQSAVTTSKDWFGLTDWAWRYLPALRGMSRGAAMPVDFPGRLREAYQDNGLDPTEPAVLGAALCQDLLDLVSVARAAVAPRPDAAHLRLLLLVDDLHAFGEEAVALLKMFGGPFSPGLGAASSDVRVAFTYDRRAGDKGVRKAIDEWFDAVAAAQSTQLGRFEGLEEELAYQHYLLNWRQGTRVGGKLTPLTAIQRQSAGGNNDYLRSLIEVFAQGIPSYLNGVAVKSAVLAYTKVPNGPFRQANDDELANSVERERKGS
jgi:hypothetical protein